MPVAASHQATEAVVAGHQVMVDHP